MTRKILSLVLALLVAVTAAQVSCLAASEGGNGYLLKLSRQVKSFELSFAPEMVTEDVCLVRTPEQVRELADLRVVELVAENEALTIQDAYSASNWENRLTGAEYAWNHVDGSGQYDCRGDGVTVAVIDSGVFPHPDLNTEKLLPVAPLYEGYAQWHGTFVTGIIAAQLNGQHIDGIAPNVSILPLCITDAAGNTSTAQAIAAIHYAVEHGADVINLSIAGGTRNALLEEACQYAADAGVIIVACAGNCTSEADARLPRYPAAFDCVVSVSACRAEGDGVTFASSFSCCGDTVDVCAPGAEIRSLNVDGGTAAKNGTSFAGPAVSAMAAIAKQYDPAINVEGFLSLLEESSTDLGEPGKDPLYGFGVINIQKFVDVLLSRPVTPVSPGQDLRPSKDLFEDVSEGDYCADPVAWAVHRGITSGTDSSHFSPGAECTRGQMVTFLYRAAGSPIPSGKQLPFTDVDRNAYYANAVQWACERGIANGISQTRFGVQEPVTRQQVVTFLWRFASPAGMKTPESGADALLGYRDADGVAEYARPAFRWAIAAGITSGTSADTLSPGNSCLRAQIVTFLYRLMG